MNQTGSSIENKYRITGKISQAKMIEYLPLSLLTSMSSLLLSSVDGIVVGNLVSDEAFASVNIFSPVAFLAGMVSVLAANGISVCLSVAGGKNDRDEIRQIKASAKVLVVVLAGMIILLQVPATFFLISTYSLPGDMKQMIRQYAMGMLLASPFGFISTIGAYQLQIVGKMKVLARLSVMEGILNLLLDILLVKFCNMGIAGAGFGTMGATITRCIATMVVIMKTTDLMKTAGAKPCGDTIREILRTGLPYASNIALITLQEYLIIMILIRGFGSDAGIILGVCNFCYGLYGVVSSSITGSMRPLVGLMTGASDNIGLKLLNRQGLMFMMALVALLAGAVMVYPQGFYHVFHVDTVPAGGLLSLRIYSLYFFLAGLNEILMLFMVNQKDSGFAAMMPVIRTGTRLVSAYLICLLGPAPLIWLSYFFSEGIECILNVKRYLAWERDERENAKDADILYLSVNPSEAIDASRMIRNYADERGYSKRISYRVSLAMEEMVAYARQAQGGMQVDSQIVINLSRHQAVFLMIDNGRQIVFDEDDDKAELVTDNYNLLRKFANSLEHQYLLDMNYTKMVFLD